MLEPDQLLKEVLKRKEQLEFCLKELDQRIQTAPEGSLRIARSNSKRQFYHRQRSKDQCGKYIRTGESALAEGLAQKDYDKKVRKELQKELDVLNSVLLNYNPSHVCEIYENQNEDRKRLIEPVLMSDEDYTDQWVKVEYERKGFRENDKEYYLDDGRRVRSKSEIIIGNKLLKCEIPFRYEYPIAVRGGIILHPDFYCLNVRKRKVFIWEHFGIMDSPDYVANTMRKVEEYSHSGYAIGDNLIVTFENMEIPLNVKLMEKNIQLHLL